MRAVDVGRHLARVTGQQSTAELWYARMGDHVRDLDRVTGCLSAAERARADGFRDQTTAERFVLTRALVRAVLSEHLATPPSALKIGATSAGKPTVHGVHFNLSHSGDLIVLAVNQQQDVGVDIERRRVVDRADALVQRWLTAAEREDLQAALDVGIDKSDAFLRIWSRKEARLKALGVGIAGAHRAPVTTVECVGLETYFAHIPRTRDANGYVGALAFA